MNTAHLLSIIDDLNDKGIPDNTILVSFDVVNMFPSIDNINGIEAVRSILDSRTTKLPPTECIIEGLEICLYNNNSKFANDNLLQVNGTATGAPNSCSYADIAMSSIDDSIFKKMESTYSELLYYGRYRDDCLSLWCGSIEKLNELHAYINSLSDDLKFTMEIGYNELCFLDLKITLKDNHLSTTVYSKPTDSHLYLHATSCHNSKSINGIPKGVALRLRRICSSENEYRNKSEEYTSYLTNRGYERKNIEKTFKTIGNLPRSEARKKVVKPNTTSRIVFTAKFNPRGPDVNEIVKRHLHLLENKPELKELFPKGSVITANKRENNLKNLLVRSNPYTMKSEVNEEKGYVRCNKRSCDSCDNYVDETSNIICFATKRRFKIRKESSCTTNNVIYVAYCKDCGKQGVGSTVCWKKRLSNYKSHIKKKIPSCKIVKHFINSCPDPTASNIRFVIVDVVNNTENLSPDELDRLLLEKEKFWIGTLITQHQGLNGSHDWNRKKRTEREKS